MDIPQFIYSPTEGHLGCFQVFIIINKASMNIHVQSFVWTCFQSGWVNTKEHNYWII